MPRIKQNTQERMDYKVFKNLETTPDSEIKFFFKRLLEFSPEAQYRWTMLYNDRCAIQFHHIIPKIDHESVKEVRKWLMRLLQDSEDIRDWWAVLRHLQWSKDFDAQDWLRTPIHKKIVSGTASHDDLRSDICEIRRESTPEAAVVMLVELASDLETHCSQWPADDLEILHRAIESKLASILEEDVWMSDASYFKLISLIKGDKRYGTLDKQLRKDAKRAGLLERKRIKREEAEGQNRINSVPATNSLRRDAGPESNLNRDIERGLRFLGLDRPNGRIGDIIQVNRR